MTVPAAVLLPVYPGYVMMLATHEDANADEIRHEISARIESSDAMFVVFRTNEKLFQVKQLVKLAAARLPPESVIEAGNHFTKTWVPALAQRDHKFSPLLGFKNRRVSRRVVCGVLFTQELYR